MLQSIKPKTWTILLYLLIPVVAFVFTVFYPLCRAVIYSFFEWKGGPNMTFNGLANYRQLFADGVFWQAFWHNIYLVVVCIIGQMGLAFILVMFANSRLTHAKGVHRTFGFFPSTISAVCIGMIWNIIYLQDGLLNTVLNKLGVITGNWMDFVTIIVIPFGAVLGAFSIYFVLGRGRIEEELNQGRTKPLPGWFGKLARAFYVPLTCVIFVLGLVYHGIG